MTSKPFIITTFFTPAYKKYVPLWKGYASKWGHPIEIIERPDMGSWHENVIQKPKVIMDVMQRFQAYNILWVDVDGFIVKDPKLIETIDDQKYDLAAFRYYPPPVKQVFQRITYPDGSNYTSGTIWIANNECSLDFMATWARYTNHEKLGDAGDQDYFNSLVQMPGLQINIYDLPVDYCFCLPLQNEDPFSGKFHDAVIIQDFASREHRR